MFPLLACTLSDARVTFCPAYAVVEGHIESAAEGRNTQAGLYPAAGRPSLMALMALANPR